ncbi:MAG: hypothetical protein M1396_00235 [Chloroflexi bacterium]|nr:hypothetical protein [Chloroflexota bacterium]
MDEHSRPRYEATTREKVIQVLLGILITLIFTAIAFGVLILFIKELHFQ